MKKFTIAAILAILAVGVMANKCEVNQPASSSAPADQQKAPDAPKQ